MIDQKPDKIEYKESKTQQKKSMQRQDLVRKEEAFTDRVGLSNLAHFQQEVMKEYLHTKQDSQLTQLTEPGIILYIFNCS